MLYTINEDFRTYLICSDYEYMQYNYDMEKLFLNVLKNTSSVSEKEMDLIISKLNYKKFFSQIEQFSKETVEDLMIRSIPLLDKFIMGKDVGYLGCESENSFFIERPVGNATEFMMFDVLLENFWSSASREANTYWDTFSTSICKINLQKRSYLFNAKEVSESYNMIVRAISLLSLDFFKDYLFWKLLKRKMPDVISFDFSFNAISSMIYFSASESILFRDKLRQINVIFGEQSFLRDGIKIYGSRFDWRFNQSTMPMLEYARVCESKNRDSIIKGLDDSFRRYMNKEMSVFPFGNIYYLNIIKGFESSYDFSNIIKSQQGKSSEERAATYCAYIATGKATKSFFRKMRSESSTFCSTATLRCLIEYRELYGNEYLSLISQYNDSKFESVVYLLEYLSPLENLTGLLGNPLSRRSIIFERINSEK